MKHKKIVLTIFILFLAWLVIFSATGIVHMVGFFRAAQVYHVNESGNEAENSLELHLSPEIPAHQSLLESIDEITVYPYYFGNFLPLFYRLPQDDELPVNCCLGYYETDEFIVRSALIADGYYKDFGLDKFLIVWEIQPKKAMNLNKYDFRVSTFQFLFSLEEDKNFMLVRYSNKNDSIWTHTPIEGSSILPPTYFPSRIYSAPNKRTTLLQIWSEGFHPIHDRGRQCLTLEIYKKGSKNPVLQYPMEWWSDNLPMSND